MTAARGPIRSAGFEGAAATEAVIMGFGRDPGTRKFVARCGEATIWRAGAAARVDAAGGPPLDCAAQFASLLCRDAIMAYHCSSALVLNLAAAFFWASVIVGVATAPPC